MYIDKEPMGVIYTIGILIGIVVGILISWGIQDVSSTSYKNQIKMAIDICEANLPRYQTCVIKGVVKE